MTIARSHNIVFAILCILLAVIVVSFVGLVITQQQVAEAEHRRFDSYRLADELRQSSDDLTRLARLFVQTGDERYADYFQEVLDIRAGLKPRPKAYDLVYWDFVLPEGKRPRPFGEAVSLEDLMIEQGFSAAEFRKLNTSQERSDKLAQLEKEAFELIREVIKSNSDVTARSTNPDIERARQIMFGDEYLRAKANIMGPINEFLGLLDERTAREHHEAHERSLWLLGTGLFLSVLTLIVAGISTVLLRRKVIRPLAVLADGARSISDGDYSHTFNESSQDEVGAVGKAFNLMVASANNALGELRGANTQLKRQQELISLEKEKSDDLLYNILPTVIAERIKAGETEIADEFPEVSVMFADLVGFTELADKLGPHKIVQTLNGIFDIFDQHLEAHNLEKIKTMGDCYMVVAGLPEPMADHARHMADFALKIKAHFDSDDAFPGLDLKLRIGIHSGTAIAGVVGTKKIAYDLWGDVVNVASRMESTGEPGEVHVSEPFMIRLRDLYEFRENRNIEVKGKGRMQTYFLVGRRYE